VPRFCLCRTWTIAFSYVSSHRSFRNATGRQLTPLSFSCSSTVLTLSSVWRRARRTSTVTQKCLPEGLRGRIAPPWRDCVAPRFRSQFAARWLTMPDGPCVPGRPLPDQGHTCVRDAAARLAIISRLTIALVSHGRRAHRCNCRLPHPKYDPIHSFQTLLTEAHN